MKVVLFCGGEGMRLRDHSGPIPKPMVEVGYRPILWHVMKYYAHFGHKDFILCLGHGADHIKRYFVGYDETVSNDFVLTGGREVELLKSDIHDWRITFVDTGFQACVGERLMAVRPFLGDDEWFLANYSDGVTDAPLDRRPDTTGPTVSSYVRAPTTDPDATREALALAYGVAGRVTKTRRLYLVGRTRIHLDAVDGLGDFLELEVVLADDESAAAGVEEAHALLDALGVPASALVATAYVDLLSA